MTSPVENLEFTVGLSTEASESLSNVEPTIQRAEEIKKELAILLENIKKEIAKDTKNPTEEKTPKEKESTKQKKDEEKTEAMEFMESLDTKQLNNLQSMATNPVAFVQAQSLAFFTKLGPHSTIIIGLVTAAISSPFVMQAIIKALAQPGGPFNRDWRRFIEQQINIGLTRLQEERAATGRDAVIFQQGDRGFVPENEVWRSSNLVHVNENRLARIGLNSTEEGLLD